MSSTGYSITTEGAVTLTGGTARSVLGLIAPAQHGTKWLGYEVGFLGVVASALPVLVELCLATFATNPPNNTVNTFVTVNQGRGLRIASSWTAAKAWTVEPTVLTVLESFPITPNAGTAIYDWPDECDWDALPSQGFVIRANAPGNVDMRASMKFARI